MAFMGDRREIWHGLGQNLRVGASIEEWAEASGFSHEILRSPVYWTAHEDIHAMLDNHVLYRSDTLAPLSVVSESYHVHQPREILEFFRDLAEGNGFTLSTAGQLYGGRRYWALASVDQSAVVMGGDTMKPYLLLCSSCDGSLKTTGKFLVTRTVCSNTLSIALGESGKTVKASHRSEFDPEKMKHHLGIVRGAFREFMETTRAMAKVKITDEAAQEFVAEAVVESGMTQKDDPRASRPFQQTMALFRGLGMGAKLENVEGTVWGLVNGATEYVDFHARGKSESHKVDNAWFGKGDAFKTLVFEKAKELVS